MKRMKKISGCLTKGFISVRFAIVSVGRGVIKSNHTESSSTTSWRTTFLTGSGNQLLPSVVGGEHDNKRPIEWTVANRPVYHHYLERQLSG